MNIDREEFDPTPQKGAPDAAESTKPPAGDFSRPPFSAVSPLAFGWIAAAVILLTYGIGSSLVLVLFADSLAGGEIQISTPGIFTASILGQILFLLLPALFFAARGPLPMRETLRLRSAPVSFFLLAAIGVIACQILGGAWLLIQELYLIPDSMAADYQQLKQSAEWLEKHLQFGSNIPLLFFALTAVAVVPAISEEFVFRGIIQRNFEARLKPTAAIVLAAFIFGAIHLQPTNFIPLVGVGAFLGFVALTSRSIWPAVFGHFVFNGFQVVFFSLAGISVEEATQPPTSADLWGLFSVAGIALIALLSILRILRRLRRFEPDFPPLSTDSFS